MQQIGNAYITSMGTFLPGPPISNDEIEGILGAVGGKPSRLRARILRSNGITSRHYALDHEQRTTYQNSEIAALAVEDCLRHARIDRSAVDMLAVASTQGDLPVPGIASMVQADLSLPPCEILTTHGVCSAGVTALKSAVNQVRLGEKANALVCASELVSRLLKKSRFEAANGDVVDFEVEFLRWMLSDGAGAALVQPHPTRAALSLRVDWIEIVSYAADFDLCMSCGTPNQRAWAPAKSLMFAECAGSLHSAGGDDVEVASGARCRQGRANDARQSWQDYPTYADAERDGALLLRQNLRLLDNILRVGAEGFLRLITQGRISPGEIDYLLCHYSSDYFRRKILDLYRMAGCMVPEERWFTNLYTKGNTGCASIFIMLEELFYSGRLQPGQVVFCIVPESARFTTAYMKLTVVEGGS